ncbi:MAG: ATP/GTP-binding protein [Archaeoglobaceae archaeon]|nr:ATP/GTP-binding protein [Archaeoglobaceae archaeon]
MELIVIGPAGSGKSTFVREFSIFLKSLGYDVKCVNLDPASDPIYPADRDVRKYVKTEDVMLDYKLGINGAMLKSVELMLRYSEELKLDSEFVLYDTPGQMELFIYSENGVELVRRLCKTHTCGVFLIDAEMVASPEHLASAILQNVVVMLRLSLPTLTVISKSDLRNIDVRSFLSKISLGKGVLSEIMEKFAPLLDYTTLRYRTLKISSIKRSGFQELFSAVRELFCVCGDLS